MSRYAVSVNCVKKVRVQLDLILENRHQSNFRIKTNHTSKLAFQIREAFAYIRKMEEDVSLRLPVYYKYAELPDLFLLRERNEFIIFERRQIEASIEVYASELPAVNISKSVAKAPVTKFEVVGYMIEHTNINVVEFPNVSVNNPDDLEAIQKWCVTNNYTFKNLSKGIEIAKIITEAINA